MKKIVTNDPTCSPFRSVAFFPWSINSLDVLWEGGLSAPENLEGWKEMISEFSGSIAVGGDGKMFVFSLRNKRRPFCCKLPHDPTPIRSVAWAINPSSHLEPLVLFTGSSVLYILNLKMGRIVSYLRGHGGPITSIAVHPTFPQIFCTTSCDFTSRIYDLTLTPQDAPNNPHWPPGTKPSLGGAAHGLHMSEKEGVGIGRCVLVLMGGRSGGHRAAVLGAAFHPVLPLIATCGLDRTVKIWYLPLLDSAGKLAREDKPLFSSSRIHKARVLSVTWLSHDILLTHGAPAHMRRNPEVHAEEHDMFLEEGTMVLWRWLGMDRFFPPGQPSQAILRGCASDYQESSSFKLVSMYSLPIIPTEHATVSTSPDLHVYQSPYHDPLVLLINLESNAICMLNVAHFSPRKAPPFPCDAEGMVELTKRMRLDDDDDGNEGMFASGSKCDIPPQASGWDVEISDGQQGNEGTRDDKLEACAMGLGGKVIVGVGSRGTVWLWTAP